jgi:hypothetical protein
VLFQFQLWKEICFAACFALNAWSQLVFQCSALLVTLACYACTHGALCVLCMRQEQQNRAACNNVPWQAGLLAAVLLSCAHLCVVDARHSLKNLECTQAAAQHCGNCVSRMCVPVLHSSRCLCSWRMTLFISPEQNRLFGQELRSQQHTWLWHQQLRSDWYRHGINCLTAFGLCRVPANGISLCEAVLLLQTVVICRCGYGEAQGLQVLAFACCTAEE